MWERFDRFADDFVRRAQQRVAQDNARRADDGVTPEVSLGKLRVAFARETGPTCAGSVLVLQRSSYVPPVAAPGAMDVPATPAALLDLLGELDRGFAARPHTTWWLAFTPGDGPDDEWHFEHAQTQDAGGARVRAADIGWIEELLPLRRPGKASRSGLAEREVEIVPITTDYGPVHEALVDVLAREARGGEPAAHCMLGVAHVAGAGVARDDALAVARYEQAARCGQLAALLLLGWMLAHGRGVARDPARARALWRRATAQGLARAQSVLGLLARGGAGIGRDLELAVECQSRAAAGGLAHAEFLLGRHHELVGPAIDPGAAWHAYRRAAMGGVRDAFARYRILPPQAPGDPWPGERRAEVAAWLRGRRSRPSERRAAEAALAVAELCDVAAAAGALSAAQVEALVAGADDGDALVRGSTQDTLRLLQGHGVDVSPVLLRLCRHGRAPVRVQALRSLAAETPADTIRQLVAAGRADRNGEVRATAEAVVGKLRGQGVDVA